MNTLCILLTTPWISVKTVEPWWKEYLLVSKHTESINLFTSDNNITCTCITNNLHVHENQIYWVHIHACQLYSQFPQWHQSKSAKNRDLPIRI